MKRLILILVLGLALGLTAAVSLTGSPAGAAVSPVVARNANMVTADALPTTQIDGVAWAQLILGGTVYVGGRFANARPAGAAAGTNLTARGNLLAYDLATGVLKTSFAPTLNGQVLTLAASPGGSILYVGGSFTTANGSSRSRIAAFDTATGALLNNFRPTVNTEVRTIVATATTVYVGGSFTSANGVARNRLAAFNAANGGLTTWNPNADAPVLTSVLSPDGSRLIVGGRFLNVGGSANYGLAAIDANTGAARPFALNQSVRDAGPNAAIYSLRTDGNEIYGTGYNYGSPEGNLEGSFSADPTTGALNWVAPCHGDSYDIYPNVNAGVAYVVSHSHHCADLGGFGQTDTPWVEHRTTAFTLQATGTANLDLMGGHLNDWYGSPTPSLVGDWLPEPLIGTYTGQNQAAWTVTGNNQYVVQGGEFPVVNGTAQQGLVRYAVGSIAPNKQGPRVTGSAFVPNLKAASATSVRVAFQLNWDRDDTSLTYTVLRDGAPIGTSTFSSLFWQRPMVGFVDTGLGAGSTHTYSINASDNDGNTAHGASVSVTLPSANPAGLSAYGQRVVADGAQRYWPLDEPSGTAFFADAAGYDDARMVGSVTRGVAGPIGGVPATAFDGSSGGGYQQRSSTVGPDTFSVEAWFRTTSTAGGQIVGFGSAQTGLSQTNDRMVYLDNSGHVIFGLLFFARRTVASPGTYNDGAWHQVVATLSSSGMVLYVDGAAVGADASTTAGQPNVPGYWRVGGDNLTGWAPAPSSNYLAGSIGQVSIYPTALTAAQVSQHRSFRTVGPVNTAPTAAFTSSTSGLTASFDGTGSFDTDGTIASYAWNFGDSSTGFGSAPSHRYAAPGTYPVTLTVTDDKGASNAVSHSVAVTSSPSPTLAADSFARTVSGGWGSANTGGAWTVSGGAANFSVRPGTGRMAQVAGGGPSAYLKSLSLGNTDSTVDVAFDKVPSGNSAYAYLVARHTGSSDYQLRVKVTPAGVAQVSVVKNVSGTGSLLQTVTLPGTYTAGTTLHLRLSVSGTSSVALAGKAWTGSTQPSAWTVTATDTSSPLGAGAPGLAGYLASGTTNAPVTLLWSNFRV